MDKAQLEQYCGIKKEIEQLEQQIREIQNNALVSRDVVRGSSTNFPYGERTYSIIGIDCDRLDKLTKTKTNRLNRLLKDEMAIEKWLDSVDASVIRQIIQLHYIKGLTWRQTATAVYGYPGEDRARMAIKRFFAKE